MKMYIRSIALSTDVCTEFVLGIYVLYMNELLSWKCFIVIFKFTYFRADYFIFKLRKRQSVCSI